MNSKRWTTSVALILLGCLQLRCTQLPGLVQPTARVLPTQSIIHVQVPDASIVVREYLDAWVSGDYPAMYALLTSLGQSALSQEEFVRHYQSVSAEAVLKPGAEGIGYEIKSVLVKPDTAQANYRVTLTSLLVGEITRDTTMNLSLERGAWRVQWDDTLILPELRGGNYLLMDRNGYVPSRANIYDRQGKALVAQTDATAIGLYPDQVDPSQIDMLFALVADLTGQRVDTMLSMYQNAPRGANWYLPLGEVSTDRVASKYDVLSGFNGLVMSSYKSRYYFDGGVAAHVLGYVGVIQPNEVETYQQLGYLQDERVGRSGLEKWGEAYLAGKRGGALYVFNAQGQLATLLAEVQAQPSQAIYTTLDGDLQLAAQQAMGYLRGAIVVLERNTGRVLAMVSNPGFDPNAFEPINYNSNALLSEIVRDPALPLFNRAAQGQYPLGSVFKIITMAAGLESGHYTPETTYQCGYIFDELPGVELHDWTYDYYLSGQSTAPSGLLTLSQGLMRSCNPWFWHISLDLYNRGLEKDVSEMARGFGLGQPTGIIGLDEAEGNMPDPNSVVDAVNMAIGQGDILVTPLQVARFVAAIGNGGVLYTPQVIEKIEAPGGQPQLQFKPQATGKLPISQETLQALQVAMLGVIRNTQPRGTAWHRFTGLDFNVAGKTGTAQSGSDRPHAWFAGYTFEDRADKPDIAVVVVVENGGEGSDYGAPIFRRIVELYFVGQPQKLYWWETALNEPFTPTPEMSDTALPDSTATPTP